MEGNAVIKFHAAHAILIVLVVAALLIGRTNAGNPPAWDQIVAELKGDDPEKVPLGRLGGAMLSAMEAHPDQSIFHLKICLKLTCRKKDDPVISTFIMLYWAVQTYPKRGEEFVAAANEICPLPAVRSNL